MLGLSPPCPQAMGGGYEYDDFYSYMDFSFLDIGNIHVMRERCTLTVEKWMPAA